MECAGVGAGHRVEGSSADRVRAVYETDHARLWRTMYAFTSSRDVADEATAEAFAQALRRGSEIRDVRAWVWASAYAIARGLLAQRVRDTEVAKADMADTTGDGDLLHVLDALRALSDSDRELVLLCHLGGWRPGELSGVLRESPGALRVRLHRATKRARALLAEVEEGR